MIEVASTLFAFSIILFAVAAILIVITVAATTKGRSTDTQDVINITAKAAMCFLAVAVASLAIVGLPLVIGLLTSAQ